MTVRADAIKRVLEVLSGEHEKYYREGDTVRATCFARAAMLLRAAIAAPAAAAATPHRDAAPGDKIIREDRGYTIKTVLYEDYHKRDGWDIEFVDDKDQYHHWKQMYDGGEFVYAATEEPEPDHTRYSNCYPGCGGEDCACCEIHAEHVADRRYCNGQPDFHESHGLYGALYGEEDDCSTECPECCEGCCWAATCEYYEEEELNEESVVASEFTDSDDEC